MLYNTIASLLLQLITIICGFIVPRLILQHYGSEVNGLVNSIAQYLGIIGFLEFGVGAVVQSSLYKPIAERNNNDISRIIVSADIFFRKLAIIMLLYIGVLIIFYPNLVKTQFDFMYTIGLIIAISISSFAQYYFGVVDRLLLTAAQRGYIQYTAQIVTLIVNTIACVILIMMDSSIHLVKLMTSIIFLARPIYLRWYANKMFQIDRNITFIGEPIKQKWNGVAQHFAAIVLDGTAMILLTTFSSLVNVSIYSVYWLVIVGVKQLCISLTSGIQALFGELWAKKELRELNRIFGQVEWCIHTVAVFMFGCTAVLITPFVSVYTQGVSDADYWQPLFGMVIALAHMGHCFRLPYNMMILAAGHYRQTQHNYIIATIVNLVVSCILVSYYGLVGVAIGAACALYYQTVWMACYVANNIIRWPIHSFVKQICVDTVSLITAGIISIFVDTRTASYLGWIMVSCKIVIIWIVTIVIINRVFYKENLEALIGKLTNSLGL